MGRALCYAGLALLAAATWFLLAGEFGWMPGEIADVWFGPLGAGGTGMIVLGLVFCALRPVGRMLRSGRCVRCGHKTERGQAYCLDHMRATVTEAQDRVRQRIEDVRRQRRTS